MSDEVWDLDGYIAETAKTLYRFTFGGREFTLPHVSDIDWRVTEAADLGNAEALRVLFERALGPDQWPAFEKITQPAGAMGELFRRWRAHAGLKPGESPASPASSESTAGPSTRRSAGTTPARRSARPSRAK